MHHFGAEVNFLVSFGSVNIKHYCCLTVFLYFKAVSLQLINLLIGALKRKPKSWFWQHPQPDTTETGHLRVLVFMPSGSSEHRAPPDPLVYRNRTYSSSPWSGHIFCPSLGGAGPTVPRLWLLELLVFSSKCWSGVTSASLAACLMLLQSYFLDCVL